MTVSAKSTKSKSIEKNAAAKLSNRERKALRKPKVSIVGNIGPLPSVGDIVSGTVKSSGRQGIIVSLPGPLVARVKLSDISTRFISGEEAAKLFRANTRLEGMSVSEVSASGAIELKLKSRIGEPEVGSIHKAVVKRVEKYGAIMNFPNSLIQCLCETEHVDDDESNCRATLSRMQPGHKYLVKVIRVEKGRIWVTLKKSELGNAYEENSILSQKTVMEFTEEEPQIMSRLIEDDEEPVLFIEDDVPEMVVSEKKRQVDTMEQVVDLEEVKKGKKTKVSKQAKKLEAESLVREKESALVAGDWRKDPQTAEEFERLILAEGTHLSAVWIKYMSFWLKLTEISKARETAERALKQASLSFVEEQEKFNLWVAYLNMEAAFGGNVDEIFTRATQYCDQKKMYHAMPQVLVRAGLKDKAEKSFERMIAKFPSCRKAWINLIDFYFTESDFETARTAFQKGVKSLPAHKHVRFTVKFAQMEFRNGFPEKGSSVFEQLVHKHAQKTDIWSVYFDECIKAFHKDQPETVRELFEKAISTKIKPFKMKFFFKRYLDFEQKYGSDHTVNFVKEKAVAYVESIAA